MFKFLFYILFTTLFVALFAYVYKYVIKPKMKDFLVHTGVGVIDRTHPRWDNILIGEEGTIMDEYMNFLFSLQISDTNGFLNQEDMRSVIIDNSQDAQYYFPRTRAILSTIPRVLSARIDPLISGESVVDKITDETNKYIFLIHGDFIILDDSHLVEKGQVRLVPATNSKHMIKTAENSIILTVETKNNMLDF